jgi:phosphoserine phosphatase
LTPLFVVFDVDSTLIDQEAIELLAEHSGTREQVAKITERAMAGEIDFSQSLIERVALLAGVRESTLEAISNNLTPTKGAKELIQYIQASGGQVAAVSGGFIQLLGPLKSALNLDFVRANTLEIDSGELTGRVSGPIVDAQAKADTLVELAAELGVPLSNTVAIGDGANDLKMMEIAGLSIAFCAKPIVNRAADVAISTRDLAQVISLLP